MRILTSWKRLAPALVATLSLTPALQAQTPILSKEYIRLGGRILAIEQAAPPGYVAPVYQGFDEIDPTGSPGWRLVGAADFDRNGTPDLVWQQTASPNAVTVNYYGPG